MKSLHRVARIAPAAFAALASFAALLLLPSTAEAKVVVSDDALYSVDLGATVCFVEPRALRSDEDCAGLDLAEFPVPSVTDPLARLAYGVVRGAGQGAARPILGVVTLIRATSHATAPPDEATAGPLGDEAVASIAASLPAGSRLIPGSKIAWGKNVPVVRSTLEAPARALEAGADAGAFAETSGRRELLTAVGGRYLYVTAWSGSRENAAELARLADAAALTTDLKPEGRPLTKLNPWPGRLLFFFGVLGLVLLQFKRKRAAAPKPPPP